MNTSNLPDDSDSSDEDYIPNTKEENESDINVSDVESPVSGSEEEGKKGQKRRKGSTKGRKFQKKNEESAFTDSKNEEVTSTLTEQEKKKKEEDIWADFMRDTGFQSKKNASEVESTSNLTKSVSSACVKTTEKVKVIEIFNFAGEEVKVEKEVDAQSTKAMKDDPRNNSKPSGLGSIINQLGKKNKINTLEKSKLDWDRFKSEENLNEELHTHNKGKDGYLERQDFLQRADLRTFEKEKEIRARERSKRFNM